MAATNFVKLKKAVYSGKKLFSAIKHSKLQRKNVS